MRILNRLLDNCRESDRQIGVRLGYSGVAIRYRMRKMLRDGVIERFVVRVEPPLLGYGLVYIVVSGEDVEDKISLVGKPYMAAPCVGGVTVYGIVVGGRVQEKIEIAKNLMKGVRVLSIFEAESLEDITNPEGRLTRTDFEVLGELVRSPRQNMDKIADATKMSTRTVSRCHERLQENKAVQFTAVYNPKKVKGYIPHVILAWINGDMKDTLKELDVLFSESYMQAPFVAKGQIVLFMYGKDVYEMDEITQGVRNTKNVKAVDLFIPKNISFYNEWLIEAIKDAKRSPRFHVDYGQRNE